ncbi:MAG: hypothetical protein JWP00_1607 [Chloroflexi bacterium]|jgi:hypothetical protein|nr:hypothetical protein [Chloroflexota bacterium]
MSAEVSVVPVVVDTANSPYASLKPVPINAVRLADRFWEPRRRINRDITIPLQYRHLEETGRIDNMRRASGKKSIPFEGIHFNDSDVHKWLEAAAWAFATDPSPDLARLIDQAALEIADMQQPNGYLHSYFVFEKEAERWTNTRFMHELYVAGHFIQAAVAHYRSTGETKLLQVAERLAGHIIDTFGPAEEGKRAEADGHPEIEMALVELYRATGETRYLDQAKFFVDVRQGMGRMNRAEYELKPFREYDRVIGHAVCAVYLTSGVTDVLAETGDPTLRTALERIWDNMVFKQLYVTGGIGSRWDNEAFGRDYELPSERAYTETCAAIGSVMWNHRMLALEGDARFADLLEHTLYNAVLPGLSLDGQSYFYQNPLADDGTHRREEWFGCACCPPNVARLLAQLPGYFYSTGPDSVYVNLYAEGSAEIQLPEEGQTVRLTTRTQYPWDGDIEVEVKSGGDFGIFLRIPAWCEEGASLEVAGERFGKALMPGSYAEIRREWQAGDKVRLRLPMPARRLEAHPYSVDTSGRVALMRGPLLYCVEKVDNPGFDLRDLVLGDEADFTGSFEPELLNGVVILQGRASVVPPDLGWQHRLYRQKTAAPAPAPHTVNLTAVPYYAWANRDPGQMLVWLRSK